MLDNQSVATEGPLTWWQPSTRAVIKGRCIIVLLLFQFQDESARESEKTDRSNGGLISDILG